MSLTRTGQFLGSYGAHAEGAITYEWVPDPFVWSEKIMQLKDNLDDRTVPLFLSQQIIADDIAQNFEGEHDPEGMPWKPWSPSYTYEDPATGRKTKTRGYADRKKPGHSGKILDWTSALRHAATDLSAFVQISGETVNNDSLYYDTGGLPPYWEWHQEGVSEWRDPGGVLPQRRFLGISGEAETEINVTFSEWFDSAIEMAVSSKGRIFQRTRHSERRQTM
jgi:phage gpG-like protein